MRHWPNAVLMSAQRLRRWPNIGGVYIACPVNTHSPGQFFYNPRSKQRSLFATQMNLRQYYYDFDSVPRNPRSF